MSGSTGVQVTPYDPNIGLKSLQGWQALRNARASNALTQQQTLNAAQENTNLQTTNTGMLQDQAMKRYEKNASAMYAVSGLPDSQFGPALSRMLDAETQSGLMKPEEAQIWKDKLSQASSSGNYGGLRQDIIGGIIRNAPTPEAAAKAVQGAQHAGYSGITPLPGPENIDTGPEIVPTSGGAVVGAGITKDVGPQMTNTQGGVQATNRGRPTGAPAIPYTLSPSEALKPETRPVYNEQTGNWDMVTKNAGEWNPSANAPIVKGGKGGPLGNGNYAPPQSAMPMGTEKQLESNQTEYQSDLKTIQPLQTGTQSLQKALNALNLVATGAGTEGLARMRSYAVSLGNVLGVDTSGVNVQDMNRAELEKYLTDYARASGTAGRSDESLNAAFKSNASGSINNSAAQDVVRTNIGRDRQKLAAIIDQQRLNPQGVNYGVNKGNVMTTTDPRGFAWDSYTDSQKKQILKEVGGPGSEGFKKLAKARGMAEQLHLLDPAFHLQENTNTAPPTQAPVMQIPPTRMQTPPANSLTAPPPNALSRYGD